MLGRNGIGNAAILWLAVIMKLSRRTCMTSTCIVECGALVDVSVAHLRVAVAKKLYSVERVTPIGPWRGLEFLEPDPVLEE